MIGWTFAYFLERLVGTVQNPEKHHVKVGLTFSGISWSCCHCLPAVLFPISSCREVGGVDYETLVKKYWRTFKNIIFTLAFPKHTELNKVPEIRNEVGANINVKHRMYW